MPDDSLDEPAFRADLRRLTDASVNVLVANHGTGESFTSSDAAMRRMLEIAKDELRGKVAVRGMGRMLRQASDHDPPPRHGRIGGPRRRADLRARHGPRADPSIAEQERYLRDVLDQTNTPAFLSLRGYAGHSYPVDLLDRIVADYPKVVGAILTTNDVLYLWEVVETLANRIEISTQTWNAMTNLALGGDGFAAPEANLAPKPCVSVMTHYREGRHPEAEAAFLQVVRLWPICGKYGSERGTKAALNILGLPGGEVRLRRLGLNRAERDEVARMLDELMN